MITNKKIIKTCTMLAIFTSSFDIFGLINIAGFNFRFCQLIILPVIALYLMNVISARHVSFPKGFRYLLIWIILQFGFCFRSPSLKNAFGYFLWLIFNCMTILSTYYFCGKAYSGKWLLKTYLHSFVFMSIVGLMQLVLYGVGINFFVVQNWTGRLARINGFSYEPSYYATYLLMGVVTYGCLLFSKEVEWIPEKDLKYGFIWVIIALFLSSSRMGWLMIAIFIGYELLGHLLKRLLTGGYVNKKMFSFILLAIIVVALAVFSVIKIFKWDLSMFTAGLGIGGGTMHSAAPRIGGLTTCLNIFKESPFLGYSLGGVDPMIAKYTGVTYSTANNGAAMSIIGEILVASGILGLIPFVLYFSTLCFGRIKSTSIANLNMIRALRVAMVFELIILCFNQNILRPYTWWHIAILSALVKNKEKSIR